MADSLSPFRSVLSSRVCGAAGGMCHPLRLQSPGQQPLHSLRTVSLFSVPPFVVGPPPPLWVAAILRSLEPSTDQGSWVHLPPSGLPCETGHCPQLGSPLALLWTLPAVHSLLPLTLIRRKSASWCHHVSYPPPGCRPSSVAFSSIFSLLVSSSCPSRPVSDSSIQPLSSDITFSHFPQSPHCALLC